MGVVMEKPKFDQDQIVTSSDIQKKFATIRKLAKDMPLVITDNGRFDTVILNYKNYEEMYSRLIELEEENQYLILSERLERLEKNPETGVSWRNIRRSNK